MKVLFKDPKEDPRLENCRYLTCNECKHNKEDTCPLDDYIMGALKGK